MCPASLVSRFVARFLLLRPLRRSSAAALRSVVLPVLSAVVFALLAAPLPSLAWGLAGHQIVAELAERQLTPQARAALERVLAVEPGASLVSIANWADDNRVPTTAAWHYVNFPRDGACDYDAAQMCPGGACVVGAIERYAAVLASARAPDQARFEALRYLVHFVADVHQPLHGGFADDRGGNRYQLQAFGRGTNLHALWDVGLIEHWPGGLGALLDAAAPHAAVRSRTGAAVATARNGPAAPDAADWAEASCRIASSNGFYPDERKLDDDYPRRWAATLAQQLGAAARRLADLLNRSFQGG